MENTQRTQKTNNKEEARQKRQTKEKRAAWGTSPARAPPRGRRWRP